VDLYFLDIHLTDGNVFDYLSRHELKKPIVFTTAYDQYALQAFKQYSIDYILKPFSRADVENALNKYKQHFHAEAPPLNDIIEHFRQPQKNYRQRIRIKIGDKFQSLPMDQIHLIYSEQKTTMMRTAEGRSYPIDSTLSALAEEVDPQQFFQVNRGMIVQIDAVQEVTIYSNSRLKVGVDHWQGEPIIVARERVSDFKDWLG
jgi:DNA-binding LytR/AlgR family response regulator